MAGKSPHVARTTHVHQMSRRNHTIKTSGIATLHAALVACLGRSEQFKQTSKSGLEQL
jgi:hypothetical protein